MRLFTFILMLCVIVSVPQSSWGQIRSMDYEESKDRNTHKVKDNAGVNKFDRITINEKALQDILSRLQKLEQRVSQLESQSSRK